MDVRISPSPLCGTVVPPPSKSLLHRLILCAGLAYGVSTIKNAAHSEDIDATLRCLTSLGGRWTEPQSGVLQIVGIGGAPRRESVPLPRFDCGESGSTLRFFLPVALAACGGGKFIGHGRLLERPLQPYFEIFQKQGVFYEQRDGILTVRGHLTPGKYTLPGNVSSQFFSGLLFALPLLSDASTLCAQTPPESADYIAMTLDALRLSGILIAAQPNQLHFSIPRGIYQPLLVSTEADWSQAAFWYAASFPCGAIQIAGLNSGSAQGDKRIEGFFQELSAPGNRVIDLAPCPDLLPPLAVMAAMRHGTTRFVHAARLRLKESDRLASTAALLTMLGGRVREFPDALEVSGSALRGGTVDGFHDHRIVMAAAVAATHCAEPVTIRGADAVNKSYPSFWDDYKRLGGNVDVL